MKHLYYRFAYTFIQGQNLEYQMFFFISFNLNICLSSNMSNFDPGRRYMQKRPKNDANNEAKTNEL